MNLSWNDDWTSVMSLLDIKQSLSYFNIMWHRRTLQPPTTYQYAKPEDEHGVMFRVFIVAYGAESRTVDREVS